MFGFKTRDRQHEATMFMLGLLSNRIHAMALDFTKLDAALDRNTKAVNALLTYTASLHPDPAVEAAAQAKLDGTASALDSASGAAEHVVPVDPPATQPA